MAGWQGVGRSVGRSVGRMDAEKLEGLEGTEGFKICKRDFFWEKEENHIPAGGRRNRKEQLTQISGRVYFSFFAGSSRKLTVEPTKKRKALKESNGSEKFTKTVSVRPVSGM
ncbi:hypothetical protein RUM43_002479 [Polyplax serrata]|uniref:Uncharacterized protein n=1 Tax=Polyplax serrata TaxID=468196 RepID=A0AAN8NTG9_POLSC